MKERKIEEQIRETIEQVDWHCSEIPVSVNRDGIEIHFDKEQYVKNVKQMLQFYTEDFQMKTGLDIGCLTSDFILMACTLVGILKHENSYSHIFDAISHLSEPKNLVLFRGKFSRFHTGSKVFRIELKLCPTAIEPILDPSTVFSDDFIYEETIGEISDTWHIILGWYEQKKEDDPIFNRNGGFRHAVSKRIPMLQWKPGHVYLDSLGKTRLYLGVRKFYILSDRKKGEVEWAKEQYCDAEETVKQSCGMICSIPYSNVESFISECKTISDVFRNLFEKAEYKEYLKYRKIAKVMIYNIPQKYYYEGIKYLELAINMNDFFAYYIYSKELFYGNILTPSPELAIGMANTSIDLHSTFEPSHIILGRAYELGRGIEKNEDKAFEIYYKSNEIAKMNNYHSSCSKAALAHCYYNGIGVTKNEALALELIKDAVDNYRENCHDYVLLLYAYFALTNKDGFSLEKAAFVFDEDITYHNSLSFIMTFKRVYKKLGNSSMVKKLSSIEKETLKNTGEFNLNYLRKYIKNYNEYYPIVFNR